MMMAYVSAWCDFTVDWHLKKIICYVDFEKKPTSNEMLLCGGDNMG